MPSNSDLPVTVRLLQAVFLLLLWVMRPELAFSQTPSPVAPKVPAAPATSVAPPPIPAPVPVADIAVQAETALLRLRQLTNRPVIQDMAENTDEQLESLARSASIASADMRRSMLQSTSLESIRNLEQLWRDIEQRASALTRDLTRSVLQLERDLAEIDRMEAQWIATRTTAAAENAPAAILKRIDEVISSIERAEKTLNDLRTQVLALQSRAANISARASQSRAVLNEASERAVARLLYRDSPPVWSTAFWSSSIDSFSQEADANLASQIASVTAYLNANRGNVLLHVIFFTVVASGLYLVRRKARVRAGTDDYLQGTIKIFEMPIVAALLISLLASTWFYERPPRAFWIALTIIGTAPVLVLARRMIEPYFYPTLYALIGFYLADNLRTFVAPLPVLSRVLFLVEGMLFITFILWSLHRFRRIAVPAEARASWYITRIIGWLAGLLAAAAVVANINGQVRLADLLGGAALSSTYAAVVLYALVRAGQGMVQGIFSIPPVSALGIVVRNKPLVTMHIYRWLRWAAYACWIWFVLQALNVFQPFINFIQETWVAAIPIGAFNPTVGDIAIFLFIVWATFMLSRLSRFVLDQEVYPKLRLERGLPYAVSRVLHYSVLLVGFVLALNALGVDMTKFTILAGAFSVGIGFGLQNIVNNFVSGLIVLFERPVKVGDTIQIDDVVGQVKHIGIRACVVASTTGAEVIIPNGKLIADKVTNWTLSGRMRQVTVPVVTKSGGDAGEVRHLLVEIARKNALVAEHPAPEALFTKRSLDSFEFELRVWTAALDQWLEIRSELLTEVNEAFQKRELASQAANVAEAAPK